MCYCWLFLWTKDIGWCDLTRERAGRTKGGLVSISASLFSSTLIVKAHDRYVSYNLWQGSADSNQKHLLLLASYQLSLAYLALQSIPDDWSLAGTRSDEGMAPRIARFDRAVHGDGSGNRSEPGQGFRLVFMMLESPLLETGLKVQSLRLEEPTSLPFTYLACHSG